MPKVSKEHEVRRRDGILRAALTCFARQGYHETTIDDVAAAAGLSKGAVYQYFDAKEDLFRAVRRLQLEDLRHRLERAFTGPGSVAARLERGAREFLATFAGEYGDLGRIVLEFWSETSRRTDLRKEHRQVYASWRQFLAATVAQGVRAGEFRTDLNPDALAAAILAVCDGLTLHHVLDRPSVDPAATLSAFLGAALHGIVAQPRTPARAPRRDRGAAGKRPAASEP